MANRHLNKDWMAQRKLKNVEVLKKNDWGVFFKGEPITSLPVQDNDKIYKVNEVAVDKLLDSIDDFIGENKEDGWKRRNQQD